MDIPDQFQKIDIFLAQDGFKAVLIKVALSVMGSIKPKGVAGQKSSHNYRNRHRSGPEK